MTNVRISHTAHYLPERIVDNQFFSQRVTARHTALALANGDDDAAFSDSTPPLLDAQVLERLFGSQRRRYAAAHQMVSDLGAAAARPIVERVGADQIDCMIFAAATADLIEPATANIVQQKLGLQCPVFDLKNACNSFVTAMQVGSALIQSGQYRNVLVVNGEKLQDGVRLDLDTPDQAKEYIAGYTLGDAAGAVFLEKCDSTSGFVYQKFMSRGEHWELCTVPGGGSMHPFSMEHQYFRGKTAQMRQTFVQEVGPLFKEAMQTVGWAATDLQHVFTHHVSLSTFDVVANYFGLPRHIFRENFIELGNIAAATIPVNLSMANEAGLLKKGDKIAIMGLGAGITIGVQLLVW